MTQKRFNIIDSAGNRSSVAADATVSYSVNGLNQYTGITPGPGSQLAYDTNGSMIQKGADTYTWDYNNRMTGATIGSKNITYMYNYNDLRISKDVLVGATYVLTRYYYNGSKLFAEGDGTKITKTYTNDNEGVLGMTRKIYDNVGAFSHYQRLYYLFDNLGSVAAVTNETGKPVQYYQYDAYGRITNAVIDPVNSLTFVGRYYGQKDWDTGFIYFWHRWYDADMGRWISRDQIGVKGGINLYSYVKNNCINKKDIKGLDGDDDLVDLTGGNPDDYYGTQAAINRRATGEIEAAGDALTVCLCTCEICNSLISGGLETSGLFEVIDDALTMHSIVTIIDIYNKYYPPE
jgi:RHS repeat-associated protein